MNYRARNRPKSFGAFEKRAPGLKPLTIRTEVQRANHYTTVPPPPPPTHTKNIPQIRMRCGSDAHYMPCGQETCQGLKFCFLKVNDKMYFLTNLSPA